MAERDSKNLTIESECQVQENEIKKTYANQKKLKEGTFKPNATDQGIRPKKKHRLEEIE